MSAAPAPDRPVAGFIGAGNMARSLAGGLLRNGWDLGRVILSDPDADQRRGAEQALGVRVYADNNEVAARADILVLAVKPQVLKDVAAGLAAAVQKKRPLVLSIAAGVRLEDLERWLGGDLPIVRSMPNAAALIGSGASGMFANARVRAPQRDQAESILRAVGVAVWLDDEYLMDVVTALSGSGPAYFFLVMEALERAAIANGLEPATARLLTLETAFGAAKMALGGREEPALLRARVTSPGGTTGQAAKGRGLWGVDFASVVLLLALKAAELYLIFLLSGVSAPLPLVALAAVADLIRLTLYVFTFAVLGRVIMSWVNPYGGHTHPVAGLLISLTEPLLRPARRPIPPGAGPDLSPIAVLVLLQLLLLALEHLLR